MLASTVRAEWCPLVSYTSNLLRIRDALFDAETAWNQVTSLFDTGRQQLSDSVSIGPFGRARRIRPRGFATSPPAVSMEVSGVRRSSSDRRPRSVFGPETYPWQWSAGVLAGLAVISVGVLTTRIRSLDRLR